MIPIPLIQPVQQEEFCDFNKFKNRLENVMGGQIVFSPKTVDSYTVLKHENQQLLIGVKRAKIKEEVKDMRHSFTSIGMPKLIDVFGSKVIDFVNKDPQTNFTTVQEAYQEPHLVTPHVKGHFIERHNEKLYYTPLTKSEISSVTTILQQVKAEYMLPVMENYLPNVKLLKEEGFIAPQGGIKLIDDITLVPYNEFVQQIATRKNIATIYSYCHINPKNSDKNIVVPYLLSNKSPFQNNEIFNYGIFIKPHKNSFEVAPPYINIKRKKRDMTEHAFVASTYASNHLGENIETLILHRIKTRQKIVAKNKEKTITNVL